MKTIFEPVSLNKLNVKNRIIRSATWEDMAAPDGSIGDDVIKVYEQLARYGIGTIITGFTSVSSKDNYFGGIMRLSDDRLIPQYRVLTDTVHKYDSKIITQLALGGYFKRLNSGKYKLTEIDDMNNEDIQFVVSQFAEAAKRAEQAGFDGIQIHAAHHFFLSRCISPACNGRNDDYGGDVNGRMKILTQIYETVRLAVSLHISVKINCSDFVYKGLDFTESMYICKALDALGIDSIEISGNGTSQRGIRAGVNEGYFLDFAKKLAEEISTPVILVGGLRSMEFMNTILNKTKIQMLSLSRPLVCEPDLISRWQNGDTEPAACISCNGCYETFHHKCVLKH